jgi:hypothetical protein
VLNIEIVVILFLGLYHRYFGSSHLIDSISNDLMKLLTAHIANRKLTYTLKSLTLYRRSSCCVSFVSLSLSLDQSVLGSRAMLRPWLFPLVLGCRVFSSRSFFRFQNFTSQILRHLIYIITLAEILSLKCRSTAKFLRTTGEF